MDSLLLKNVPEDLLQRLEESAHRHNRTIEEEAVEQLEIALKDFDSAPVDDVQNILRRIEEIRSHVGGAAASGDSLHMSQDHRD